MEEKEIQVNLFQTECVALFFGLKQQKKIELEKDPTIEGFN